jgi:DNA-binding transcriptional MerR regulator
MFPIVIVVQVLEIIPYRLRRWEEKGLFVPKHKNGRC